MRPNFIYFNTHLNECTQNVNALKTNEPLIVGINFCMLFSQWLRFDCTMKMNGDNPMVNFNHNKYWTMKLRKNTQISVCMLLAKTEKIRIA